MKSRLLTIVSVLVFGLGLGIFLNAKSSKAPTPARSYVITYMVSKSDQSGDLKHAGLYTRSVKATGEWLETRYEFDGKSSVWAATDTAVYSMNKGDKTRQYRSGWSLEMDKAFRSASFLESHPEFVRREKVAGMTAYVHRLEQGDVVLERAFSPALGITPLRMYIKNNNEETLIEATKVEFTEVTDADVRLPDVPLAFDYVERKIEAMKANGLFPQADALRQRVDKIKQSTNQ